MQPNDAPGKTVSEINTTDDMVAIVFTDGECLVLRADCECSSDGCFSGCSVVATFLSREEIAELGPNTKFDLRLVTKAQYDFLIEQKRLERAEKTRDKELSLLAQLKAKYEPNP